MCTYLHTRGRRYYFRRSVPVELAPFILTSTGKPRLEWLISLSTSDRATAKRLIPEDTIRTEAELTNARARLATASHAPPAPKIRRMRSPSEGKLEAIAFLDQHTREQDWAYERREEAREQLQQQLKGSTASMPQMVQAARDLIRRANYAATLADERRIVAEYNLAEAKALPPAPPAPAPPSAGKADAAIMGLFEGYIAERQPSASTVRSWRPIMAHLIRTLGHDDASRVTPRDMVEWKNELLAEVNADGDASRSARTVADVYLASVKVVFGWAVDNLRIPSNPAHGVKVRVPKSVKLREPGFTDAEALMILRAALVPPSSNLAPENVLARRWVPWLCAYTGARVNEIGQLRGQDIQQIDDVWTIRITPEAGSVKNNAARIVPIHEHLIAQGFLDVAKRNGAGHLFYDPS